MRPAAAGLTTGTRLGANTWTVSLRFDAAANHPSGAGAGGSFGAGEVAASQSFTSSSVAQCPPLTGLATSQRFGPASVAVAPNCQSPIMLALLDFWQCQRPRVFTLRHFGFPSRCLWNP